MTDYAVIDSEMKAGLVARLSGLSYTSSCMW